MIDRASTADILLVEQRTIESPNQPEQTSWAKTKHVCAVFPASSSFHIKRWFSVFRLLPYHTYFLRLLPDVFAGCYAAAYQIHIYMMQLVAFVFLTDSTIAPPPQKKKQRFSSTNVPWLLDRRKYAVEKRLHVFSCLQRTTKRSPRRGGKGHRISGDTRPGAGFDTGDFGQRKFRGATSTVERLFSWTRWSILPREGNKRACFKMMLQNKYQVHNE